VKSCREIGIVRPKELSFLAVYESSYFRRRRVAANLQSDESNLPQQRPDSIANSTAVFDCMRVKAIFADSQVIRRIAAIQYFIRKTPSLRSAQFQEERRETIRKRSLIG
jgi:hypothetical protein